MSTPNPQTVEAYAQSARDWETFDPGADGAEPHPSLMALKHLPDGSWWTRLKWSRKVQTDPLRVSGSPLNLATVLQHDPRWSGILAYDVFGSDVVMLRRPPWHDDDGSKHFVRGPWTDIDTTRLRLWFQRAFGASLGKDTVDAVLGAVSANRPFHPVCEHLAALNWDGTPRLDSWLSEYCNVEDSAYVRSVGKAFLVSMVARVAWPGCKVDTMLVLEGEQGYGKSSILRILAGDDWYLEHVGPIDTKETPQLFRRKWLVELGELATLRKTDVETMKGFTSRTVDTYRPPYARRSQDFLRQCVLAGTTNAQVYLHDETGGRRYLPVIVPNTVNLPRLAAARDQLLAEAAVAFWCGASWHITPEMVGHTTEEQDARYQEDPWQECIETFCSETSRALHGVTIETILVDCLKYEVKDIRRLEQLRVGSVLRKLGWKRKKIKINGCRSWVYAPSASPSARTNGTNDVAVSQPDSSWRTNEQPENAFTDLLS